MGCWDLETPAILIFMNFETEAWLAPYSGSILTSLYLSIENMLIARFCLLDCETNLYH